MARTDSDDVTEGLEVFGADSASLGKVGRVYRDDDTGRPEWAVVGGRFIPVRDVRYDVDGLHVDYTREQVEGSPAADADAGFLTRAQEADLYLHYGIDYDVTTLIQHQTGGQHGGASGEHLAEDDGASGAAGAVEGGVEGGADRHVRPGVLDEGVSARDQSEALTGTGAGSAGEQVFGTGAGGTLMGNAGTGSAAGTNATTRLDEREDLTVSSGTETSSEDGDIRGSGMSDIASDDR